MPDAESLPCDARPEGDEHLGAWMHWLLTTHAGRYNRAHALQGHVWQGRFHACPIEQEEHLLTVLRYVERNALRTKLVPRAEDWPWSSLAERRTPALGPFLHPGPVPVPVADDWVRHVNAPRTEAELHRLRQVVQRGCPFGSAGWVKQTALALGLESTLRPRGRPTRCAEAATVPGQPSLFPTEEALKNALGPEWPNRRRPRRSGR